MPRIYLALEVDFDNDEKVARLARYAKAGEARACRDLLVAMWRYCKAERTDGHVPFEIVGKLCYPDPVRLGIRDADRLVEVGLAERTETGYFFGKFLKRNKSKAEIEALAQKKADAGRIGGKASGLSRKGEADGKQPASTPRSHTYTPTHLTPDTSISESSFEGERPVTLHAVPASEPPRPTSSCTRHPHGNPTDENCVGCKRDKESRERKHARNAERDRLAAEAAARNCTRCDGTWEVDDNRHPTRRKCDHTRRTA